FGQSYSQIYVNDNGHLTFNAPLSTYSPERFPMNGTRDIIAPFWTDLDNRGNGDIYYVQYTSGSLLQRVTQDINTYFPALNFQANWIFIATWHEVAYYSKSGTQTTLQAVLTTNGHYSFVLMNYGSIASTSKSVQVGDIKINACSDDGSSPRISLLRTFNYFGQSYSQIYVNHNGHLTFDSSWSSFSPQRFPMYGTRDIIAPFWTDLDNRENGEIYYVQYTNGSLLQRVTQDINAYFPALNFQANWIFIATWHEIAYYPMTRTQTTFQAVLTTNGKYSFVLMNYGSIASTSRSVQVRAVQTNSYQDMFYLFFIGPRQCIFL
uniref:NIDO domain-containing protein n=1 Tax=Poecilia mexicana TaxID=48701 RepID=A0A3B3WQ15_9TELE